MSAFTVDWEAKRVICPNRCTNSSWTPTLIMGQSVIGVRFHRGRLPAVSGAHPVYPLSYCSSACDIQNERQPPDHTDYPPATNDT